MKEFIAELFTGIGQKIAMFVLIGTTALTTGTAVSKVVLKQTGAEHKNPTSQEAVVLPETSAGTTERKITLFEDDSEIVTPTPTKTKSATLTPSATPTVVPKATVTPTKNTAANTANNCIVTIFGKLYDVASLRSSHSGGDVFKCDTDMSSSYQSKHGTSVSRMSRYAYDPNNPTATPANTTSSTKISDEEEDEREDRRNEDRYEDVEDEEDN